MKKNLILILFLLMLSILILPLISATAPTIDSISSPTPFNENNLSASCVGIDADNDTLTYEYRWKNGTNILTNNWTINTSLISGLGGIHPTLFYNFSGNEKLTIITGTNVNTILGYEYNGTDWELNNSIVTGIDLTGYVGGVIMPDVVYDFNGNGKWTLFLGHREYYPVVRYYEWNGTIWVRNSSLDLPSASNTNWVCPATIFNITSDDYWTLMSGNWYGYLNSWKYTTSWSYFYSSQIMDTNPRITIYKNKYKDRFEGIFTWSSSYVTRYWTGSSWVNDATILNGATSSSDSKYSILEHNNELIMIKSDSNGYNKAPLTNNLSSDFFTTGDNLTFSCRVYDGTEYSEWSSITDLIVQNNDLVIDYYNVSNYESDLGETIQPLLNFTSKFESYDYANVSIYVDDVLQTTYNMSCDAISINEWNCTGNDYIGLEGVNKFVFLVSYNDTINTTATLQYTISQEIYSNPDLTYSLIGTNTSNYNQSFNISIWQSNDYSLDYNMSCAFDETNISIVNVLNFSVNGTNLSDSTKVQINVSFTDLIDDSYEGYCLITRKLDNATKNISLTYVKDSNVAQLRLLDISNSSCENTLLGVCGELDSKDSDDVFSYYFQLENYGLDGASSCNFYLDNDFVGKTFYNFNLTDFSIIASEKKSVTLTFSSVSTGNYQGNLYIQCDNASGYVINNDYTNQPFYYLLINTAQVLTGGGGGSSGYEIEDIGNCSDVDISPMTIKFTATGLKEIQVYNYQTNSYSPEITITGDLQNYLKVTNLVSLLPLTKGEFGVSYVRDNFTEGESIITLTDAKCGIKEIYVIAQSQSVTSDIFDLFFMEGNNLIDFFKEPVFSREQIELRNNTPLFSVGLVQLIAFLLILLFFYNIYSTSLKNKNYIKLLLFIILNLVFSFIIMLFVVNYIRGML